MSAILGNNPGKESLEQAAEEAAEEAGVPVLVMYILDLARPQFPKVNNGELLELSQRAIRFANTPSSERTHKVPGMKGRYSLCDDKAGAELSGTVLNGEPTEDQIIEFITHAKECDPCHGNFIHLVWMTTGD